MSIASSFRSFFAFRSASTTVLVTLLYTVIFVSLYVADQLPSTPSAEQQYDLGLDLEEAYRDLHVITSRPHPFNSHQNDLVRTYLLQRVHEIAEGHVHVHVEDDATSSTYIDRSKAVYFEGNNILVKIDGTEDTEGNGVLFSAHFDSVSTSYGATDDGTNAVALLQAIKYFAENRPRLTAVFNINNGEEDGLHGAHSFLNHPWSNLTTKFLNFEGAGAGGRPFLFRTTSVDILRAFQHVAHPHANVLSADVWKRGVIRSDTDYSVYAAPRAAVPDPSSPGYTGPGGGMRGADVAFYKGRARYHTIDDTVRGMGRGTARRALWSVMEIMRSAGGALLEAADDDEVVDQTNGAVYFELFGTYLVAFPFRVLLAANFVLLVAGPIIIAALAFSLYRQSALSPQRRWVDLARGYGRFWLALLVSIGAQVGLVVGYIKLNPMIIHSHHVVVTLSALSLSYLTLTIPLSLAQRFRPIPPAKQKLAVLINLYVLTWILLVGATVVALQTGIAGTYWVGAWNVGVLAAVVFALAEGLWGKGRAGREILADESGDHVSGEGERVAVDVSEQEVEASETTPLIRRSLALRKRDRDIGDEEVQDQAYMWWIFQAVLSLPVPLISLGAILFIWVSAMPQTVPDGGWVGVVYGPLSLLCFLLLLPAAPFAHKMHRSLTLFVLVVFAGTTAYAWLTWPFSAPDGKLKVFFAHEAELSNVTGIRGHANSSVDADMSPHTVRAVTHLSAIPGYTELLVQELPSSWRTDGVSCKAEWGRTTCSWAVHGRRMPSIPAISQKDAPWFHVNASRTDASSVRLAIRGTNTRACNVRLDNRVVRWFRARTIDLSGQKAGAWYELEVPEAVRTSRVDLWSRAWDQTFELDLQLDDTNSADEEAPIRGVIACTWAEYHTAADGGRRLLADIPALEEVFAFLPEWAAVTKAGEGLVEAVSSFEL